MRQCLLTLLLLVAPLAVWASLPYPYPYAFPTTTGKAFVVRAGDCAVQDFWINAVVWIKAEGRMADSVEALQAWWTRPCSAEAIAAQPTAFYPVVHNEAHQLTYAIYDLYGTLSPSTMLVGVSTPPFEMMNQLLPQGRAFQLLELQYAQRHANDRDPLDEFSGPKTITFIPVRYQRGDTLYHTFEGSDGQEIIPWHASNWLNMVFTDILPHSPGGYQPNQTLKNWYLTATNGLVTFVHDSARYDYVPGYEGLACRIDTVNDYIIPWDFPCPRSYFESENFDSDSVTRFLDAQGVNAHGGDPNNIVCLVWMEDFLTEGWNSHLYPYAWIGNGWCQIGSNAMGDIIGLGEIIHEIAHAGPGLPDDYRNPGYSDCFNPMSSGAYNMQGWRTPYFPAPRALLWYATRHFPRGIEDSLYYNFLPFTSVNFVNGSTHIQQEAIYIQLIDNKDGYRGLIADGEQLATRLLVWHLIPDSGARTIIETIVKLEPADNDTVMFYPPRHTKGYACGDTNALPPRSWLRGDTSSIVVGVDQIINYQDSSAARFKVHRNPANFSLLTDSIRWITLDSLWVPSFTLCNTGESWDSIHVHVTSSNAILIPDFELVFPDSILMGDTITMVASDTFHISNNPELAGSVATLTLNLPYHVQATSIGLIYQESPTLITNRFSYPAVFSLDTMENHLLVGSHDTLYCFDSSGSLLWQRIPWPGHAVNHICIGNVRGTPDYDLEIVLGIDGQRIYLLSNSGSVFSDWPISATDIASPCAMIVDGYVWYIDGSTLQAFDATLRLPPYYGTPSRTTISFPSDIHPDAWCWLGNPAMGDSVTGTAFAFTTGLNSRVNGQFFVMDAGGNVIYARDSLRADASHGYGAPNALELIPLDGWSEVRFSYYDSQNHGGEMTCSYSVELNQIGMGYTSFGDLEVIAGSDGVTRGAVSEWTARPVFTYYDSTSHRCHLRIGDKSQYSGTTIESNYMISAIFDSLQGSHLITANENRVSLYNPFGDSVNQYYSTVAMWADSDVAVGAPMLLAQSTGNRILFTPKGDTSGWGFDHRIISHTSGFDWLGPYGNPASDGRHGYLSFVSDTSHGDDQISTTLYRTSSDSATLYVDINGYRTWIVNGYNLYSAKLFGIDERQEFFAAPGKRHWEHNVSFGDSSVRAQYYYVTINYTFLPDGQTLWGQHIFTP